MTPGLKTPLTIEHIAFGPDGIEPFYWPVGRGELVAFRDTLLVRLVPLLNRGVADKEPCAREARLLSLFWLSEAMGLYQAVLLEQRLRGAGRIPLHGPRCRLWNAVFQGRPPEAAPLLVQLAGAELSRRKSPFRIFSKLFSPCAKPAADSKLDVVPFTALRKQELPDIPSVSFPARSVLADGVVATRRSDIITMHASACGRKAVHVVSGRWFAPLGGAEAAPAVSPELFGALCDAVAQSFQECGAQLPEFLRTYLLAQVSRACGLVAAHLARLVDRNSALPARLWTGTGGNIWDRMLRLAVRDCGGQVTGHDHALGDSYLAWQESFFLNEFFECDTFVTYTKKQRDLLAEQIRRSPPLAGHCPRIESVAWPAGTSAADAFVRFPLPVRLRRVMVIGVFYVGEQVRVYPLQPDVVAVDFQARLLAKLHEWGFQAVFKEHPESAVRAPAKFESELGARNDARPFEQVIEDADVLLFSCLRTSTFNITMRTNKPAVYLDFNEDDFAEDARSLLSRRCPIVAAGVTQENRVWIDWEELRAALLESPARAMNTQFFERYLLDS